MRPEKLAFFAAGLDEKDIIMMLKKGIADYERNGKLEEILPACSLAMNKVVINEKGLEYLLRSIKAAEADGKPAMKVNLN